MAIIQTIVYSKNAKKSHIEKVVYRVSRACQISADVILNVNINIIITSGGNGGILIITFLF